jgi:hypothetical protein
MDDDNITGTGIFIATEHDLDAMFANGPAEAFDIPIIPGHNIMTGCYGLFLVALDQCADVTEKASLEEAITSLDDLKECLVSCALTLYYPKVNIDYVGILTLADAMIFLSDELPGKLLSEVADETMASIDDQLSTILGISQEAAVASMFDALGFTPVEITDDGRKQLKLDI